MKNLTHSFNTKSKILKLKSLKNNLFYYITEVDGIKIFSSPESKILKNIQTETITATLTPISITSDSKFIAYANDKKIIILSIETNTIINTIEIYEKITTICFDASDSYIFVGTIDSNIYQYKMKKDILLSKIYQFPKSKYNYVDILISNNTNLITADKYGRVSIVDIYTYNSYELTISSKVQITSICFIDEENAVIGDIRGYISFISLQTHKITKKLTTPFDTISTIITTPNKDFVILNTNGYYLTLIDTKIKKIKILKYLSFKNKIIDIAINGNGLLYIAFDNNNIMNINIYNINKLMKYIESENIEKAYKLLESNPILKNSLEYEFLEEKYKIAYKNATLGLINNDKIPLIQVKSIYRNISQKNQELQELEDAFKEYEHLKYLYKEKKYPICYALIDKFPPLKATIEYKKLEERYKTLLLAAQHNMSIDKKDIAYEILKEYITVASKRPTIKILLKNNDEFEKYQKINKQKAKLNTDTFNFHKAYEQNDFKRCFELLDKNIVLNSLEIAKLLNKHYQKIIYKCDKLALNGDIKSVQKELGDFIKISTRKHKTSTLLKVSFRVKIKSLMDKKETFKEAENMIYSYIDIFGMDDELSLLMKEFEELTAIKLAISEEYQIKKDKNSWFYSDFFNPSDK